MDLDSVRDCFRVANQMIKTVRKNFSRKYRNKSLSCPSCSYPTTGYSVNSDSSNNPSIVISNNSDILRPADTQLHILEECVAFRDLREQFDTRDDLQILQESRRETYQERRRLRSSKFLLPPTLLPSSSLFLSLCC